jgi:hypothetical protein
LNDNFKNIDFWYTGDTSLIREMSQFGSPHKLCPSSPKKSRNEVEWDKCIICQVSNPELLIKMRNVSKNSRNLWCVWFMIRARRLNLEETAISSTCVRLIARPVVQHTCIITPKIINIRNKKSRNEVEWDKCIICQVSTPELLIKMRNVSKNSLIEAMEASVFFRVVHSVSEYAQCNVCRRVIGLFVQQRNLWCVWFMIRAHRLNLEETAILSTCLLVLQNVGMKLNETNVLYARSLPLSYLLKWEMLVKTAS